MALPSSHWLMSDEKRSVHKLSCAEACAGDSANSTSALPSPLRHACIHNGLYIHTYIMDYIYIHTYKYVYIYMHTHTSALPSWLGHACRKLVQV